MTAPGIFPVAISWRRYSPIRSSFGCDGPDSEWTAESAKAETPGSAAPDAIRTASAIATRRQIAEASILQRFIDQLLDFALDPLPFRWRLLQQQEKHILPGIDDEVAAAGAVPLQLA